MTEPRNYLAPYCAPEECDHEGDADWHLCSQCCPCPDCGAERYHDATEETR